MKSKSGGKGPRRPRPPSDPQYQVGYGRPPLHTQFKPGQSGNPRGRPKGARSLAATVRKVLGRKIPVIERGQRKLVSADEAMLHRYLEMALEGDVKAGAFLLGFLERFQPGERTTPSLKRSPKGRRRLWRGWSSAGRTVEDGHAGSRRQ